MALGNSLHENRGGGSAMPAIPEFLLRRVYVKGSLRRVQGGLALDLNNNLASATIIGLSDQAVGVERFAPESVTVRRGSEVMRGQDVSVSHPFFFQQGDTLTLELHGQGPVGTGPIDISLGFITEEVGNLNFTVSDTIR
jgi:hypothetical protein